MQQSTKWLAGVSIAVLFLSLVHLVAEADAASILEELEISDSDPYRILPGAQAEEYWIVDMSEGFIVLTEETPGTWQYEPYPLQHVYDASGPDINGLVYCSSYVEGTGGAVQIIDILNRDLVETVSLGPDYVLTSLSLLQDETGVFILGWDWPRVGEGYSWGESIVHPDTGIVWEIDTTTHEILDQGVTCPLPETIFYTDSGTLLVGTQGVEYVHNSVLSQGTTLSAIVDILSLGSGLPRLEQIACPHTLSPFTNDFVDWSDDQPLVALCCLLLDQVADDENFRKALWVINTDTNEVVQRLTVLDADGKVRGVNHALISSVHPGWVYVTLGSGSIDRTVGMLIIDHDTGALIDSITTYPNTWPEFMYELEDGRLIVTGGETGLIQIIDPTG